MPREKDGYRDNLALLNEMYPDVLMLNIKQTAAVYGLKPITVKRYVPFKDGMVSKAVLARCMCPD